MPLPTRVSGELFPSCSVCFDHLLLVLPSVSFLSMSHPQLRLHSMDEDEWGPVSPFTPTQPDHLPAPASYYEHNQNVMHPPFTASSRPAPRSLLGSLTYAVVRFSGSRRRALCLGLLLALILAFFVLGDPTSHAKTLLRNQASHDHDDLSAIAQLHSTQTELPAAPIHPLPTTPHVAVTPSPPEPVIFSLIMFSTDSAREGAVLIKASSLYPLLRSCLWLT
jgi:hypothetical protein